MTARSDELSGLNASQLSSTFAGMLGAVPVHEGGDLLGVEHEYSITRAATAVDFATRVHTFGLGIRHLDPADPNAYPLDSGSVITCDGEEAEIALAPLDVQPDCAFEASRRTELERSRLAGALGEEHEIDGYSTHLSVWTPPSVGDEVARIFVSRFAAAMMLFFDRRSSPGLLVRPRPNRTELCGENVEGPFLTRATIWAVSCVAACLSVSPEARRIGSLPVILQSKISGTPERFGWYVDRGAFGPDLYAHGRRTRLVSVDGRCLSAQEHLECVWEFARDAATARFSRGEVASVDAAVTGDAPLPIECDDHDLETLEPRRLHPRRRRQPRVQHTLQGLTGVRRPGFDLAPVMVTWTVSLYLVADTSRRRRSIVAVPYRVLPTFERLLATGALDTLLTAYLRTSNGDRVLTDREQIATAGLFDDVPSRMALLLPEREPDTDAVFEPR
jgi:hypothetical protein